MSGDTTKTNVYALGSSEHETERLVTQAPLADAGTRRLFAEAGLRPGLSVLDIGSGAGDVSFLAREFVGSEGSVLGLDRDPINLAKARDRAQSLSFPNVTFREADLSQHPTFDREFDAIVGRRVLMYLPDRAAILRGLLRFLRPGGLVAFEEQDTETEQPRLLPSFELYERWYRRCQQVFRATGTETRMGSLLQGLLVECGLEHPNLLSGSGEATPAEDLSIATAGMDNQIRMVRALLPLMAEHGIVPQNELAAFEEHAAVIRREVAEGRLIHYRIAGHGVWALKPER